MNIHFNKIEKIIIFFLRKIFLYLILFYRTIGSLHFGGCCRFQPSCSEYSLFIINNFPLSRAVKLISKRIFQCRPGGGGGYYPPPEVILPESMSNKHK